MPDWPVAEFVSLHTLPRMYKLYKYLSLFLFVFVTIFFWFYKFLGVVTRISVWFGTLFLLHFFEYFFPGNIGLTSLNIVDLIGRHRVFTTFVQNPTVSELLSIRLESVYYFLYDFFHSALNVSPYTDFPQLQLDPKIIHVLWIIFWY